MTTSNVPWEARSSGESAVREGAYNWEAALSARGTASAWSPWWASDLPPPPVEPIMLTGGIPDPPSLPVEGLIAANERVLRREAEFALMYGGPQGYPGLREWLARDVNRLERLTLGAEHFVLTCGSSGALENICETFVDPGDVVILEQPCYPGTTRLVRACLPDIAGVPVDEDGLCVEDLERVIDEAIAAGKRPKLLYTIANFQNPAASTLTVDRRRQVIDLCRRHGVLIVQDDAYGAINFETEPLPSLFALAGGTGAVLLGTFSKTLATGLRVGWIMGEQPVIDAVTRMRFDMGVSPWTSRVLGEFCESGAYDAHLPKVVEIYRRKRDVMLAALDERCARYGRWSVPKGGFFVWFETTDVVDPSRLRLMAHEEGVSYVGGAAFFAEGGGKQFIRLCYSNVAEREIPEAIMRLGRALERAAG
jgi:2-aminoadipate transaminase